MVAAQDYITVILYMFVASMAVLFFVNVSLRAVGRINKLNLSLLIALIFTVGLCIFSLIYFNHGFADSRNNQRSTDVSIISDAIYAYQSEAGARLTSLGKVPKCPKVNFIGSDPGLIDLFSKLKEISLPVLPVDPTKGSPQNSGYTMCVTEGSRVIIAAPYAENAKIISAKK